MGYAVESLLLESRGGRAEHLANTFEARIYIRTKVINRRFPFLAAHKVRVKSGSTEGFVGRCLTWS